MTFIFSILLIRDDKNPDWYALYWQKREYVHYENFPYSYGNFAHEDILFSFDKNMIKIETSNYKTHPTVITFLNNHRIKNGIEVYNVH